MVICKNFSINERIQVVLVCDVNLDRAKKLVNRYYSNQDCRGYTDYRELIGHGDLDAVMHALSDHRHGIISVDCTQAGLYIHGQMLLAGILQEGRAICEAVRQYGRLWQTGSWLRSVLNFRRAVELVILGRIGKVRYVGRLVKTGD